MAAPATTSAPQDAETGTRLYVQNLPAYVDSARLREHFATQGEVTDAVVIRTKDSSKSRRFGFVGFKSAQQAEKALRFFHQSFFDTCKINVRVALAVRACLHATHAVSMALTSFVC
jgi:multiple RNA-binding domain-containing protein 1